jgi:RecJ-like exonuclease
MENNLECPNCLGTGEIANQRRAKTCKICKGNGKVDEFKYQNYLGKLKILE